MGHDPWQVTHDPLTHPQNVTHRPIDPWVTDPFAALLPGVRGACTAWRNSAYERRSSAAQPVRAATQQDGGHLQEDVGADTPEVSPCSPQGHALRLREGCDQKL